MRSQNLTDTRGLRLAFESAAALGTFSTAADWIWARFIPDGAVLPGVVHGALVFLLLALVLARAAGTSAARRRLLLSLPAIGLAIAAAFYPVASAVGYLGALLATWTAMWLSLALLQRWARDMREAVYTTLTRGLLAAAGSGLAFWAISGIWTDPSSHTTYLARLVYWILAFLPGFAALLYRQPGDSAQPKALPSLPPRRPRA